MHDVTPHQKGQIAVINQIEEATKRNIVSVIAPVADFDTDSRICLTSVHFPQESLIKEIQRQIIEPLKTKFPDVYYYKSGSIHTTIKNIKIISNPPTFSEEDINVVKSEFSKVLSKHKKYTTYFYRLLLLPSGLSLMGTTDPELDSINFDLDEALNRIGLPDDKKYVNKKYFFSNVTLARFQKPIPDEFKMEVEKISKSLAIEPYVVDSVTLISTNAAITICRKIHTWSLQG